MKKSILLAILCVSLLTGCGQRAESAATTETTTVSQVSAVIQAESTTTTEVISDKVTTTNSDRIPSETVTTNASTQTLPTSTSVLAEEQTTTTASPTTIGTSQPAQTTSTTTTKEKTTTTKQPAVTATTSTTTKPVTTTSQKPVTTTRVTTTTVVTTTTITGPVITDTNLYGFYFDISDKLDDPIVDWTKITLQVGLFIEEYPTNYRELYEKGASFTGTAQEKAVAILNYAYSLGGRNCIDYALNAYFLYQGAGLQTAITFESYNEWYGHVANVVKINGEWMSFDASADRYSSSLYSTVKAFDIYENKITIQ